MQRALRKHLPVHFTRYFYNRRGVMDGYTAGVGHYANDRTADTSSQVVDHVRKYEGPYARKLTSC